MNFDDEVYDKQSLLKKIYEGLYMNAVTISVPWHKWPGDQLTTNAGVFRIPQDLTSTTSLIQFNVIRISHNFSLRYDTETQLKSYSTLFQIVFWKLGKNIDWGRRNWEELHVVQDKTQTGR